MNPWKWMVDAFTTAIGKFLGPSFETGADLFGAFVLQTPLMLDFDWVKLSWASMAGVAALLTFILILIGLIRMYRKDDASINWKQTGGIVVAAIVLSMSTLFIVDWMSYLWHSSFSTLIQPVLVREYKAEANQPFIIKEDLEDHEIDFDAFDTGALLLLSYGSGSQEVMDPSEEAMSDATGSTGYMGGRVYQSVAHYIEKDVYEYFLMENGGDGGLTMVFAMLVSWLEGVYGVIRVGVLGLLAGGGPIWMTLAIYTTKWTTMGVYFYLVNITIAVGYVFKFAWVFNVMIARAEFGFTYGRQTIALMLYIIALVLTTYLWLRVVMWAVREPLTLGGAKFVETYGGAVSKIGEDLSDTGQFFGMKKVKKAGNEAQVHGGAMDQFSQDLASGNVNDGVRNHLDKLHDAQRKQYFEEAGKKKAFLGTTFGEKVEKSTVTGVSAVGMSDDDFSDLIEENGLSEVVEYNEGNILVKDEYVDQVKQIIKDNYIEENLEAFTHNTVDGQIVMNEDVLPVIRENAEENEVPIAELTYLNLSGNQRLEELHQQAKSFVPIDEEKEGPSYTSDGKIGVMFDNEKRYKEMKSVFESFGVSFTEEKDGVGSKLRKSKKDLIMFIDQAEYEGLDKKFNMLHELKQSGVEERSGAVFDKTIAEDIQELEQVKEILNEFNVTFEDRSAIFIEESEVDHVMENLFDYPYELDAKEKRRSVKRSFVSYRIDSKHAYKDIRRELYTQLPAGSILTETKKSARKKEIYIDQRFSEEAMRAIKAYDSRQPYWKDGSMYVYEVKGVGMLMDTDPPENGRYMGIAPVNIKGGIAY